MRTQRLYLKLYEVNQLEGTYLTAFLFKQHSFLNKNHVRSAVHLTQRLRIVEQLLMDRQRMSIKDSGFEYYVTQLKKLTKENCPYDCIYPAVIMCSNANIADQRKVAQSLTVCLYRGFGYGKIEPLIAEFNVKTVQTLLREIPELEQQIALQRQTTGQHYTAMTK